MKVGIGYYHLLPEGREKEAFKYVRAIRNHDKRIYAWNYLSFKLHPEINNEPPAENIGSLTAQMVRLRIENILES